RGNFLTDLAFFRSTKSDPVPSSSPCRSINYCLTEHAFFFCLYPPRRPTSTLFPYTTLFRSVLRHDLLPVEHRQPARVAEQLLGADRKSTRLNSSHVEISYAVFCLKKKKTDSNRR